MKKAKDILFIIGTVLGFIAVATFVICAIFSFVAISGSGFMKDYIMKLIDAAGANVEIPEEVFDAIYMGACIGAGIGCLISGVFSLLSAVFSLKATKAEDRKLYILNIVFGILGSNYVSIVGAIFGFIALNRQPKTIDNQY